MNCSTGALWVARGKSASIRQQQTQKNTRPQGRDHNTAMQKLCALAVTEPSSDLPNSLLKAGGAQQKLLHTFVVSAGSWE